MHMPLPLSSKQKVGCVIEGGEVDIFCEKIALFRNVLQKEKNTTPATCLVGTEVYSVMRNLAFSIVSRFQPFQRT